MCFAQHVKIRHEKFGSVVFDTLREKVFVTNVGGADILKLIQEGKGAEDISDSLGEVYDCDLQLLKSDVEEFLKQMRNSNLIK